MNSQETYCFNQLKKAVFDTFSKTQSTPASFESFGKEDIIAFQEALFNTVKTKVSEKWFYTYFKKPPEKLPRIDMLNLLSQYAGFQNWNEFKVENKKPKKNKVLWITPILIVVLGFIFLPKENDFLFCFIDEDKNEKISEIINLEILINGESPIHLQTDKKACFNYSSREEKITFVVKSQHYKTDTIIRHFDHQGDVKLRVDDYALMLDYYSKGKIKNINARKKQLQKLIDDDALIYQLYPNEIGIEIYSKEDFINLLTIPTRSLKNIVYLSKEYKNEKIVKLKFMIP